MQKKKYHFIGIGGIGMSALAQVLHAQGHSVQGSEKIHSKTVALLEKLGVPVMLGHSVENIVGVDLVVWSTAIARDNVELSAARAAEKKIMHRAELLAEIAATQRSIAVAGMHGKTTTTNMIFQMLRAGGLDPTLISGGIDLSLGSNAHVGKDPVLVFEADESDGTIVLYRPQFAVLTNIEEEHMGFYRDLAHIEGVFGEFIAGLDPRGCLVYSAEDKVAVAVAQRATVPAISFAAAGDAQISAQNIRMQPHETIFEVWKNGDVLGEIVLQVPGKHNISNALAAVGIGLAWGLDFSVIAKGLAEFHGTMRRLECKAEIHGVRVIDDYAHHPTEIRASLQALAQNKTGKLVVVFQPHRFTRVGHWGEEFARAFELADEVVLTPIYSAGEANPLGLSSEILAQKIRLSGHSAVQSSQDFSEIAADLAGRLHPGDIVVGMGAGDVEKFIPLLKQALLAQNSAPKALAC